MFRTTSYRCLNQSYRERELHLQPHGVKRSQHDAVSVRSRRRGNGRDDETAVLAEDFTRIVQEGAHRVEHEVELWPVLEEALEVLPVVENDVVDTELLGCWHCPRADGRRYVASPRFDELNRETADWVVSAVHQESRTAR